MIFRNLETGVEWEVTNQDRISELEKSNEYEKILTEIEKEVEKPKTKKKETK